MYSTIVNFTVCMETCTLSWIYVHHDMIIVLMVVLTFREIHVPANV